MAQCLKGNDPTGDTPIFHWTHGLMGGRVNHPGSRFWLFIEWFFHRDYCFSKGLLNQQFQGTILLIVFDLLGLGRFFPLDETMKQILYEGSIELVRWTTTQSGYEWIWSNYSDLTRPHPKWWFSKGNPLISGKSRLVKYYNLARIRKNASALNITNLP